MLLCKESETGGQRCRSEFMGSQQHRLTRRPLHHTFTTRWPDISPQHIERPADVSADIMSVYNSDLQFFYVYQSRNNINRVERV